MKKKLLMLSSSFAVIALAGCGGGGGGGTATNSATPVPVPSTLQAAGTTKTYDVNSAVGLVQNQAFIQERIDQAGGGSTITATTDASGNLSTLSFSILTNGSTVNQTYQNFALLSPNLFNLNTLTQGFNNPNNNTNYAFVSMLINSTNTLSYTAYGLWGSANGGNTNVGTLSAGVPTTAMPISGTATFNGTTLGSATETLSYFPRTSTPMALWGNIQLVANFSSRIISTNISNIQTQSINNSVIGTLSNINGSATISGNQYLGTLSGGGLSGTQVGSFYGPNAVETGGTWKVSGGGVTAIGSYGAKQ